VRFLCESKSSPARLLVRGYRSCRPVGLRASRSNPVSSNSASNYRQMEASSCFDAKATSLEFVQDRCRHLHASAALERLGDFMRPRARHDRRAKVFGLQMNTGIKSLRWPLKLAGTDIGNADPRAPISWQGGESRSLYTRREVASEWLSKIASSGTM
jgi:hypothetical protein